MAIGEERGGRVEFLDALRGVAILGILPVNAAFFAFTSSDSGWGAWRDRAGAADGVAATAVDALFTSKFHTLFALMFGVGMAILHARAKEEGAAWGPRIARRLGFLWLVGCLHGLLVWYGDIVAYYALFGLALAWTPGRSPAALRGWGVALVAFSLLPWIGAFVAAAAGVGWVGDVVEGLAGGEAPDGRSPVWTPGSWEGFGRAMISFDPDFEAAVFREGSFLQATALRGMLWSMSALVVVPLWGPRIAGLFLIGMSFAREGWFLAPASEAGRRAFDRMLRWGIATGVPLTVASVLLPRLAPHDPAALTGALLAEAAGSLGLAAAYAALVARACAARPGAAWIRAVAATGRMAFSNYLLQSVAMTLVFYGSTILLGAGLGLFGALSRVEVLGIAAGLAGAQVAGSVLWLRAFRMGPVEWVWRAATYLRVPPLRRGPVSEEVGP